MLGTGDPRRVPSCNPREARLAVRGTQWSFCSSRLPDKRGFTREGADDRVGSEPLAGAPGWDEPRDSSTGRSRCLINTRD